MTTPTMPKAKSRVVWPSPAEIEAIGREAVQDAIRMHKKLGVPIVVWQDGKVVEIAPEEIVVDERIAT